MGRVVLVTGVSRGLGGTLARRLAGSPDVERVIGVDVVSPDEDLGDVLFRLAEQGDAVVSEIIETEGVDTIVHLAGGARWLGGGLASIDRSSVAGSLELLRACQQAPDVRRVVMASSTRVYGSTHRDPAMFTEDMVTRDRLGASSARDYVEVEEALRRFAGRRPDVDVTVLRLANLAGPTVETALTRHLQLPLVPTVLGFDPRLQFLHEEDALAALGQAALGDAEGTYNVSGHGAMMLSQALRRLGRPSVPLPGRALSRLGSASARMRRSGVCSEPIAFLSYGGCVDTTAMRLVFGFEPAFTTAQAFDDFARSVSPGALGAERVAAVEERIRSVVMAAGADGR